MRNPWAVGGVLASVATGVIGALIAIMLWHQYTTTDLLARRMSDMQQHLSTQAIEGRSSLENQIGGLETRFGQMESALNARLTRVEARITKRLDTLDQADEELWRVQRTISDQLRKPANSN